MAQFVVHVFELIEAQGASALTVMRAEARRAHGSATGLAMGVACLCVAVPLFVGGAGLLAAGLMWWLEAEVGRPAAAALAGAAVLMTGGLFVGAFKLLTTREQA